MDLGLSGKRAIVCGSSKGLGKACAQALLAEGVHVFINGRDEGRLAEAAEDLIQATGNDSVEIVACDVTTAVGREQLISACSTPDILINNAGGPPPGDFRDWDQKIWFDALNANMLSSIEMIKLSLDGMIDRQFGRIINITSIAVKLPQTELALSNAARCGLTGFVSGVARTVAQHNVTMNNLLPGFIETDRMRNILKSKADAQDTSAAEYADEFLSKIPAKRAGRPQEFGEICAFLASQQASYLTAQNILVDGGLYPGTF